MMQQRGATAARGPLGAALREATQGGDLLRVRLRSF
jgi:hypothetical protein